MKRLLLTTLLLLLVPVAALAQDDDEWPSLSYLRSDYKSVALVAHIRVEKAEITDRIPGYETWKINAVVLEPFKGKLKKGDALEYFHGAEAGFKVDWFMGEKIVFLLAENDKVRGPFYTVLENSTLPYTPARVKKLRSIQKSYLSKRKRS